MEQERKIVQEDGVSPKLTRIKRRKRMIVLITVLIVGGGIYFGLDFLTAPKEHKISNYTSAFVVKESMTLSIDATGTVVLPKQVDLVSAQEGYSHSLLVKEGDFIDSEDALALIQVPELEDKKIDLQGDLLSAQISMEETQVQYQHSIESMETAIKRKKDQLLELQTEAEELREISSLRSSRESDYEAALDKVNSAQEELEDAEKDLILQRKMKEIAITKQDALIQQILTSLERVNEDIQEMEIKSPIRGEVLSINEDLAVPGSLILQKTSLFKIADPSYTFIDLEVYEEYAGLLSLGDEIELTVGGETFQAQISRIGKVAALSSDGISATVSLRAKPVENLQLTMGASAVAVIPLGTKQDALTLPRGAYLSTGAREYLYRIEGNKAVKVSITLGETQGKQVEILSGVKEGDEVIISSYRDFINQDMVILEE